MPVIDSEKQGIPGLPVIVELTASVLSLDISVNVWVSLARYIARGIKNAKNIIVAFYRVGEYIKIEAEKSKARIRVTSIIEVAKIYEDGKRAAMLEATFPPATRDKILERLELLMDRHFDEIVYKY